MPYAPLNVGPLYLDNTTADIPPNMQVQVQQMASGQVTISGIWVGTPWLDGMNRLHLRSRQTAFPRLDAPACHLAKRDLTFNNGVVGRAEFMCLLADLWFREPEPTKAGMVVFYLTGVNFLSDGLGMDGREMTFQGQTTRWTLTLFDQPLETKAKLRDEGGEVITATLAAVVSAAGDFNQELEDEASAIAWLLGFASGHGVRIARMDLVTEDNWPIASRLWPGSGGGGQLTGPLPFDDIHVGATLGRYISVTLPQFSQHQDTYRLRALINLSLLARRQQPTEATALCCANLLEVLRHNYATNVLVPTGRARVEPGSTDILWPIGQNGGRRMYFNEIIAAFCQEHQLTGWDPQYKDIRNSVVHMGEVAGATPMDRWRNAMALLHFCDRAILCLIGADRVEVPYYRVGLNDYQRFAL